MLFFYSLVVSHSFYVSLSTISIKHTPPSTISQIVVLSSLQELKRKQQVQTTEKMDSDSEEREMSEEERESGEEDGEDLRLNSVVETELTSGDVLDRFR